MIEKTRQKSIPEKWKKRCPGEVAISYGLVQNKRLRWSRNFVKNEPKDDLKLNKNLPQRHSQNNEYKSRNRPMERRMVEKVDSSRQRGERFGAEGSLQMKIKIVH